MKKTNGNGHATKFVQCQYISCSENESKFFVFITSHHHLNIQHSDYFSNIVQPS